ncbi:MAG: DUF4252 domain-containing protein [Bacteroidales bacterium]|nr:DUF4252 domain-containing protein [Bacteroidales bacterium]
MKKVLNFIIVLCVVIFCSQDMKAKSALESIADIDGVEYIYISESMLGSMGCDQIMSAYNLGEVAASLTSLEILECDLVESEKELDLIREKLASITKEMLLMSKIKEDDETVTIYTRKEGDVTTQMLLIVDAVEEISVIYLKGKINSEAIKNLSYL